MIIMSLNKFSQTDHIFTISSRLSRINTLVKLHLYFLPLLSPGKDNVTTIFTSNNVV